MDYFCKCCFYSTKNRYNFAKHYLTKKHIANAQEETVQKELNSQLYICNKCEKSLCSKQRLLSHIKSCRGVSSTLECSKCNQHFNSESTRYKHEIKCQSSNLIVYDKNNNPIPITSIGNNNTFNNTFNNDNSKTINITVNNFGSEKFEYFMESPEFIGFMNKCIENNADGICNLIVKKHFDPEHPENHNIRKLNKKDNFLEIFKNNKWNTKDYKSGLDHITIPLETTFNVFMEKMVEQNCEIQKNIFQHFMKEVGSILEWDLSIDKHNFSFNNKNMQNDMDDKSKKMLKTKIYKLFCESIYNYTKMIH